MIFDRERIRQVAHNWAKVHNPEMEEAAAEAYEAGVIDVLTSINNYINK